MGLCGWWYTAKWHATFSSDWKMSLAWAFICFPVVMTSHPPITMKGACRHAWLLKAISQHLSNENREGRNERQGTLRLLCASWQEKNVNCAMRSLISERCWGSRGRGLGNVMSERLLRGSKSESEGELRSPHAVVRPVSLRSGWEHTLPTWRGRATMTL